MRKIVLAHLVWLFVMNIEGTSQTYISGFVQDEKGQPIILAQVFIEETFEGEATDEEGAFSFMSEAKGKVGLIVRMQNYKSERKEIELMGDSISINIMMVPSDYQLNTVVISAGAFEASDEKKGTLLKPLDIVTNPGAEGDVYGAIRTLPGVSQVGEETGIFVRGGEAYETQTIIDGTVVRRPFFSQVPDVPARGRFDPFLFKGVMFSTGGYSAEFGQALSSVLLLNTEGIPDNTTTSVGINMAGIDVSHTRVWNQQTALIGSIGYSHLGPLFSIVPQNRDWLKEPRGIGTSWAFRHQGKQGMYKSYFQYQDGNIGIAIPNLDNEGQVDAFLNENQNLYWNNSYKGIIGDKWTLYAGAALNRDIDENSFDIHDFGTRTLQAQGKVTVGRSIGDRVLLTFGTDIWRMQEEYYYESQSWDILDHYISGFSEADISLGQHFAIRMGLRTEYSTLLDRSNVAPRTSFAYRVGKNSQLSLAYGQFYQTPQNQFLYETSALDFEKSSHYIANYQWLGEGYTFRAEVYHKQYSNLIRDDEELIYDNDGKGKSTGIDMFWRDTRSVEGLDYWVTYSYLHANRRYLDYPTTAVPTFVTPHTVNVVANYNVRLWRLGASYVYASGRTYRNPLQTDFLSDRTPAYHQLRMSTSYITSILGSFSVIYASVGNPFGWDQIFGYRYSSDGLRREATIPASTRTFFLGVFMSFE